MAEDIATKSDRELPPVGKRLCLLPCSLVEEFKKLCYGAAHAAALVARGELSRAADATLQGLVHGLAVEKAECAGLSAVTRSAMQRIPWLSLATLFDEEVRGVYTSLRRELLDAKDLDSCLAGNLVRMAEAAAAHVAWTRLCSRPNKSRGWAHLVELVWASWRCYWGKAPWRGANIGGWLLLEPGPSAGLWAEAQAEHADIHDEYGLCAHLESIGRQDLIEVHRSTFLKEDDFQYLTQRGFNAVRIPFGYWVITGPTNGERFLGPAMRHLDRAIDLAEQFDFQVVLDLHGNPGGESGERPCGRLNQDWSESNWRRDEALEVLALVAKRYAGRKCVTGIQVANEPSIKCQMGPLCDWFEAAIRTVRGAGMQPEDVAVILPVHVHVRLEAFVSVWCSRGNFFRYENAVLDLHYYHCFGAGWERLDHDEHLGLVEHHRRVLQSLPCAMVGEWSLCRPASASTVECAEKEFADAQLDAYAAASHGWFFWNFSDTQDHWNLRTCISKGWFPSELRMPQEPSLDESSGAACSECALRYRPRRPVPGRFPQSYGSDERDFVLGRRQMPAEAAPDQGHSNSTLQNAANGQCSAANNGEAVAKLADCPGVESAALRRFFTESTTRHLAEAVECTLEAAAEALATCNGDTDAAACRLLVGKSTLDSSLQAGACVPTDSSTEQMRGQKRPREPNSD